MREAVIVDAVRTPIGRGKPGKGGLNPIHPVDLLAHSLREIVDRTGIDPERIDDVIGGCVDQVDEQAMNITRSAVLAAGLPETVPATTVDRQCGSSQQAVHFGAQGVMAGAYDIVIAAGVESMSRVPMWSNVTNGADPFGPGVAARYPDGPGAPGHQRRADRRQVGAPALRARPVLAWRATSARRPPTPTARSTTS